VKRNRLPHESGYPAINGLRVSDEYFTPYCNNYNQWLQYQTYDVTIMLGENNRLEVLLGNGWYKGEFGFDPALFQSYGTDFKLIAELRIQLDGGKEIIVGTDESWKVVHSQIIDSSIHHGKTLDTTLPEQQPCAAPQCAAPDAALTESLSPPVRIQETIQSAALLRTQADEIVYVSLPVQPYDCNSAKYFRTEISIGRIFAQTKRISISFPMARNTF